MSNAQKIGTIIGTLFGLIFLMTFISVLFVIPMYLLWNWLMPVIFGLPVITLWQAIGLSLLSTILFKNTNIKRD